jgi:hypothetical protein
MHPNSISGNIYLIQLLTPKNYKMFENIDENTKIYAIYHEKVAFDIFFHLQ